MQMRINHSPAPVLWNVSGWQFGLINVPGQLNPSSFVITFVCDHSDYILLESIVGEIPQWKCYIFFLMDRTSTPVIDNYCYLLYMKGVSSSSLYYSVIWLWDRLSLFLLDAALINSIAFKNGLFSILSHTCDYWQMRALFLLQCCKRYLLISQSKFSHVKRYAYIFTKLGSQHSVVAAIFSTFCNNYLEKQFICMQCANEQQNSQHQRTSFQ